MIADWERVLTVHQPWAWALVSGLKDVENRSQRTRYRGRLWIQSSVTRSSMKVGTEFMESLGLTVPADLTMGSILGSVDLIDCQGPGKSASPWYTPGKFAWVVTGGRMLVEPVPCRGKLGMFNAADAFRVAGVDPANEPEFS